MKIWVVSHTSSKVVDLIRIKYIQLIIPQLGVICRSSNTRYNYTFIIPINQNRSEVIQYYDNSNFNQIQNVNKTITHLDIIVKDQRNRIIHLNGSEISLLISIYC